MKTSFIFSGQGSQHVGMGKDIFDKYEIVQKTFKEAEETLDLELTRLCFYGPAEELSRTSNTQPAIVTFEVSIARLLDEAGIKPSYVAGHSVGQYAAMVAAKIVDFPTAVSLASKRGQLMENAYPTGGGMAALIGLEADVVEGICKEASKKGICSPANYNSPGQIVISGKAEAVELACKLAEKAGAKRAIMLDVSGPFHSELMKSAAEGLSQHLESIKFNKPEVPFVDNVTSIEVSDPVELKKLFIDQVTNPVLWEQSIKYIISKGITTFYEIGPGNVLKGLSRRIERSANVYTTGDIKSLEKLLELHDRRG